MNLTDTGRTIHYNYVTNVYKYEGQDFIFTFKYIGDSNMEVHSVFGLVTVDLDNYSEYDEAELYDRIAFDIIKQFVNK